jgi:SsrA-binding protein
MAKQHADDAEGIQLIASNKKAFHDYFITDRVEVGIVLQGTEVKALREGGCNLKDSYARLTPNAEAELLNCHISPYRQGNRFNADPTRTRRLLMHKQEIRKLDQKVREKGMTLVALRLYFKAGRAKIELGLAKGKDAPDKRASVRDREGKLEAQRAFKMAKR